MPRSSPCFSLVLLVSIAFGFGGNAIAGSDEEAISTRLVEVGLTVQQQIELAQYNHERGTLDQATLERQADAAAGALEDLDRRIHGLPEETRKALSLKLRAIRSQASNLARAAELGSVPPRRHSEAARVKHPNRRFDGLRAAPANDNCEDAFVVGLGTYAGDTTEATNDGEAVCGASLFTPDVWYRFVPAASARLVAETTGSSYDTVLSVHSGCPGTMSNQIVCNDDSTGLQSKVSFWAWAGNEYLIRVSGSNGAVGPYTLSLSFGGAIEGTITDSSAGSPVSTWVAVFDGGGFFVASSSSDATGFYSVDGLGAGDHFVATDGSGETVDELYDNRPCPGGPQSGCDPTTGDSVSVSVGGVTGGIDFVLDRNGVITGVVRDGATMLGISDARVNIYELDGGYLERDYTDVDGVYRLDGLPPGGYYLWVTASDHLPELYDDILCIGGPPVGCAFADGTTVPALLNTTTSGIDFDLERLGGIEGTVVDRTSGLPILYADVDVYDESGDRVKDGSTGPDGSYEIGGLPDGEYYLQASRYNEYVTQLFDGMDCPPDGCEILTGTPVSVAGQATVTGVDFGLIAKGGVSGRVEDETTGLGIQGVDVRVYDDTGSYVGYDHTDSSGDYDVDELHTGTYFVIAADDEYFNELYDDLPCPAGCDPTIGTPVAVSNAVTTTGVDFGIVAKGKISGMVTAEIGGDPVTMRMFLYDHLGASIRSDDSIGGVYEFTGIDDGQYFVVADESYSTEPFLEELYDDIPCWGGPPEGCVVTDGTPVAAAAATSTTGIDFSLLRKGSIDGFVTDTSSQSPVSAGFVAVMEVSDPGVWYDFESLDSGGYYLFEGLLPGEYVVVVNASNHRDEVWNDLPCQTEFPDGCDIAGGTPISISVASVVINVDFSLDRLGSVGGTVRSQANGSALPGLLVSVFSGDGQEVDYGWSDDQGIYRFDWLWPGTYYAATVSRHPNFVDQLYEGVSCPQGPPDGCDPTNGTPLAVGLGTSNRWVDFNLESTGGVSGRVTDGHTGLPLEDVRVRAWDSEGGRRTAGYTDIDGVFTISGLEGGMFFIATEEYGTFNPSYIDLLFDGIPCPGGPQSGCDPTKGTSVAVFPGAITGSIDFALPRRLAGINGTITDLPGGEPLQGIQADVWNGVSGEYEAGVVTNSAGTYLIDLDPGTYVVTTDNPGAWVNQIFDGIVCPVGSAYNGDCDPLTGDVVTVTDGELTENIDFTLAPTFAIFDDGFESGTTVRWSVTLP